MAKPDLEAVAIRRVHPKRYLARRDIPFDMDAPTENLKRMVVGAHRRHRRESFQLTPAEVYEACCANPYVQALFVVKRRHGPTAGSSLTNEMEEVVEFDSVADLIRLGQVSPEMAYLDGYLQRKEALVGPTSANS